MTIAGLERARFRTVPFSLTFTVIRIRPATVVVYDEQEQRQRTIPRAVFEQALRQKALVYLGIAKRRSA